MRWVRVADRVVWRHVLILLAMLLCLAASVSAQGPGAPAATDRLLLQWLSPQSVIALALVLLYVGELRGDVRRIKERLSQIDVWRDGLDERYMPRETLEARLREISHGKAGA